VKYALFKTLRTIPYVPSDIDILLFDQKQFSLIYKLLYVRENYKIIEWGPKSVTIRNPKNKINIDLYNEIAVSNLIYIDKNNLKKYIKKTYISNCEIIMLMSEADLLVSLNHSLIKEQLYTLADFYNILFETKNYTQKQINTFIELTKISRSEFVVITILALTNLLHSYVFYDDFSYCFSCSHFS